MKTIRFFLIVLLISIFEPNVKGNIDSNHITNNSVVMNVEKYVRSGLHYLKLNSLNILIKDLPKEFIASFENGIELKGFVSKHDEGYIIYVLNGITKKDLINMISHEIVHISQYETNELMVCSGTIIWKGYDFNNLSNISYESLPWEVEAFNNQNRIRKQISSIR
jgi:hypothetical protein